MEHVVKEIDLWSTCVHVKAAYIRLYTVIEPRVTGPGNRPGWRLAGGAEKGGGAHRNDVMP